MSHPDLCPYRTHHFPNVRAFGKDMLREGKHFLRLLCGTLCQP